LKVCSYPAAWLRAATREKTKSEVPAMSRNLGGSGFLAGHKGGEQREKMRGCGCRGVGKYVRNVPAEQHHGGIATKIGGGWFNRIDNLEGE